MQIPNDLFFTPKNLEFSTRNFFQMIFFLSIIQKISHFQAKFLTFFNRLPQKQSLSSQF